MTLDVQPRKTRFSDQMTIKCDPETKKAILEFARQSGTSLCQIYDGLTKAFLHGVSVKKDLAVQSPTINLSIERSVLRARRHSVSDSPIDIDSYNNFYSFDGSAGGQWLHREGALNENNHAVGCECSWCKPFRPLATLRGKPRSFGHG